MDVYGIPKAINRHVLKALYFMKNCGYKSTEPSKICNLVRYTMKRNVPVMDFTAKVLQSLENMAELGIIERIGSKFLIQNNLKNKSYIKLSKGFRKNNHNKSDRIANNARERQTKVFRLSKSFIKSQKPDSKRGIAKKSYVRKEPMTPFSCFRSLVWQALRIFDFVFGNLPGNKTTNSVPIKQLYCRSPRCSNITRSYMNLNSLKRDLKMQNE